MAVKGEGMKTGAAGAPLPTEPEGRRGLIAAYFEQTDAPVPPVNLKSLPDDQVNDLFENVYHGPDLKRAGEVLSDGELKPDKSPKPLKFKACPRCKSESFRRVNPDSEACHVCGFWRYKEDDR